MTGAEDRSEEFLPPTALESAVRALGADTIRYRVDYVMLPMRDGVRLATVVFRPRAEGRYPAILVRSPYSAPSPTSSSRCIPRSSRRTTCCHAERAWQRMVRGRLRVPDHHDRGRAGHSRLDRAREWSNGKVGMHGCSSTAENQLKLAAIGHPALRACVPMSSGAGVGEIPGRRGRTAASSAAAFP